MRRYFLRMTATKIDSARTPALMLLCYSLRLYHLSKSFAWECESTQSHKECTKKDRKNKRNGNTVPGTSWNVSSGTSDENNATNEIPKRLTWQKTVINSAIYYAQHIPSSSALQSMSSHINHHQRLPLSPHSPIIDSNKPTRQRGRHELLAHQNRN